MPDGGAGSCTFTNTAAAGDVSVTKTALGVIDGYDWSFDFQIRDDETGVIQILTVDSTTPGGVATLGGLVPGAQYTLLEVTQTGWTGTLELRRSPTSIPSSRGGSSSWFPELRWHATPRTPRHPPA